jgi:hypothetical protein
MFIGGDANARETPVNLGKARICAISRFSSSDDPARLALSKKSRQIGNLLETICIGQMRRERAAGGSKHVPVFRCADLEGVE